MQLLPPPRPEKTWHSDKVLDQGSTYHCVGFAFTAFGISMPVEDPWDNQMGHNIYRSCKILDGDPDGEEGSTIRSGVRVMKSIGRISTYFFATSIDEAAEYVARFGPVVIGTNWYEGMNKSSDVLGIIRPKGKIVGGHAYLWIGVTEKYAIIRNSWGTDWGLNGDARISLSDLKIMFEDQGEACAAVELSLPMGRRNA
jgi:hypothetical protein